MRTTAAPALTSDPQPRLAATLGMWVFLASELMFFGPLFFGYWYGRLHFPDAFTSASRDMDIVLGTLNTTILLTSSFFVATAVDAFEHEAEQAAVVMLRVAAALGIAFLAIKGIEYAKDWHRGLIPGAASGLSAGERLFFLIYFAMTALHALHLMIGVTLMLIFAVVLRSASRPQREARRLRAVGLYWHFVDALWIVLFPILYLVGRSTS